MELYFGGAEKASFRVTLQHAGVERVALNHTHLRVPAKKDLDLGEIYEGQQLMLYRSDQPDEEEPDTYVDFVREHADSLDLVIGYPGMDMKFLGPKLWVQWNDPFDLPRLEELCKRHGQVAISDRDLTDAKVLHRVKSLLFRWEPQLLLLSSKVDLIQQLPCAVVMVGSWSSSVRYGETQVWDGHVLHRYPKVQKDAVRRRHRKDINALGVSFDDVMEDDTTAVATLAIKSWMAWEKAVYTTPAPGDSDPFEGAPDVVVATTEGGEVTDVDEDREGVGVAIERGVTRHGRSPQLLPTMRVTQLVPTMFSGLDEQGELIDTGAPAIDVLTAAKTSQRQCNSCYLQGKCPGYEADAHCKYEIPVEIRTREQVHAFMAAVIELQGERVLFAHFGEQLEGQGLDSSVSTEMDRLFNLVAKLKDITDNRDTLKLTLETKTKAGAGALSRIFGSRVTEARELPMADQLDGEETEDILATMLGA